MSKRPMWRTGQPGKEIALWEEISRLPGGGQKRILSVTLAGSVQNGSNRHSMPVRTACRRVGHVVADGADLQTALRGAESPPTLKRKAMIEKYAAAWTSIERDLRDAHKNGLAEAARTHKHGYWSVIDALQWAQARGKFAERRHMNFNLPWSSR